MIKFRIDTRLEIGVETQIVGEKLFQENPQKTIFHSIYATFIQKGASVSKDPISELPTTSVLMTINDKDIVFLSYFIL